MTQEAKIVFDFKDISKIRVVCTRCDAEFVYTLRQLDEEVAKEAIASFPTECGGCGKVWNNGLNRQRDLVKLIRSLVQQPSEKPAVHLGIKINDPYRFQNEETKEA